LEWRNYHGVLKNTPGGLVSSEGLNQQMGTSMGYSRKILFRYETAFKFTFEEGNEKNTMGFSGMGFNFFLERVKNNDKIISRKF
jgi:hypothetical protein